MYTYVGVCAVVHLDCTHRFINTWTSPPRYRGTLTFASRQMVRQSSSSDVCLRAQIFPVQRATLSLQQGLRGVPRPAGGGGAASLPAAQLGGVCPLLWGQWGYDWVRMYYLCSIPDAELAASGLNGFMVLCKGSCGLSTLLVEGYTWLRCHIVDTSPQSPRDPQL